MLMKIIKYFYIVLLACIICTSNIYSQNRDVQHTEDSLINSLEKTQIDSIKQDILSQLGDLYDFTEKESNFKMLRSLALPLVDIKNSNDLKIKIINPLLSDLANQTGKV